jgi:glutaredoxin
MIQHRLYYFSACPFCKRVIAVINRLGLEVELCDIKRSSNHLHTLIRNGGLAQVPCLRIVSETQKDHWQYESAEIIHYFEHQYA